MVGGGAGQVYAWAARSGPPYPRAVPWPVLLLVLLLASGARAQGAPEAALRFDGYALGAAVALHDGGRQVLVAAPFSEARVPVAPGLRLAYGGRLLWGSDPFVEVAVSGGALLRLPGSPVSLHAGAHVGTFLLSTASVTGEAGLTLELPLGSGRALSVEADVLYRASGRLVALGIAPEDGAGVLRDSAGFGLGVGLRL